MDQTHVILNALEKFINSRSNIERGNYSDYRSFASEKRNITANGTRARKALAEARTYPPNHKELEEAFKRAFSGRLSWDGSKLEYCTGQYYPTEYRKAAAAVLECYNHAVRPKFLPADGVTYTSIGQIRAASQAAGSHWFDRSTLRFFRSRMCPQVYHGKAGVFFVSSEQGPNGIRAYTVRQFHPKDADISAFGPFNELTLEKALRIARIASEYLEAAKEALAS